MGFEDHIVRGIDRGRKNKDELSPTMLRAHEKATREVLTNPDYVIQEKDFNSVYTKERVQGDINTASKIKAKFDAGYTERERNALKIAETFEAIILMQSEMSNWLGNANTLKTSRFDDYVNKVDMIAEWSSAEGSRLLALGVDVTFGTTKIAEKIAAIKAEIDNDELGTIRYFRDSRGDFIGTRNNVPRTVIGVSQPIVTELAGLWVNNDKKALGTHPIQELLVSEMETQILAILKYATKFEKPKSIQSYQQALSAVRGIRSARSSRIENSLSNDPVAQSIMFQTREQFKTPA